MNKNLYFLSQITDAFQKADTQRELEKAFNNIAELGQKLEYHLGYLQFLRFMDEVKKLHKAHSRNLRDAIIGKTQDGESDMGFGFEAATRMPELMLDKDGECVLSISIKNLPITGMIRTALPGYYEFRLDTGRVLWGGRLTEKELIWAYAFPEQDLDLAAATDQTMPRTSLKISLFGGNLTIQIFPGIESGQIEITITE